eukprot:1019011-Ditylum_brightwellii.AAC.1
MEVIQATYCFVGHKDLGDSDKWSILEVLNLGISALYKEREIRKAKICIQVTLAADAKKVVVNRSL